MHCIRVLKLVTALAFLCVSTVSPAAEPVLLGVDVFLNGYTHLVANARVGLITNQTGRTVNGTTTIDALQRHSDVNLVALFALEHGIQGRIGAGETVDDALAGDLPVFSLYAGGDHKPRKEALDRVDVLIYDIQDVGSRAYTYIWSLAKLMEAAAEHEKRVIVLDRPNPLGGLTVDGPIVEDRWRSFIGLYPIPRVYGLTVGELARFMNAEYQIGCSLTVIPMAGYRRNMAWKDVGHVWTASSPNIPSPESAVCFASTGTIGTLGTLHIGIGTEEPFQVVGAPWIDADASARDLNLMRLPGVRFRPRTFRSMQGPYHGKIVHAVFLDVVDATRFQPVRTEVAMLAHFAARYPKHFKIPGDRRERFDRAMGTSAVREAIARGDSARQIWARWHQDIRDFSVKRQVYFLYRSGPTD